MRPPGACWARRSHTGPSIYGTEKARFKWANYRPKMDPQLSAQYLEASSAWVGAEEILRPRWEYSIRVADAAPNWSVECRNGAPYERPRIFLHLVAAGSPSDGRGNGLL